MAILSLLNALKWTDQVVVNVSEPPDHPIIVLRLMSTYGITTLNYHFCLLDKSLHRSLS